MKKVTIHAVIVKSKVLNDGSHKVRLSVSHNSQTRYITTEILVPSEKNVRKGEIVGLPNANALNRKIRGRINELYDLCDNIIGIEHLSCAELVSVLEDGGLRTPTTFEEVAEEWLKAKIDIKDTSVSRYELCINTFKAYIGEGFVLQTLTPTKVNSFLSHLKKKGLASSTINMRMSVIRNIVRFATNKRGYFRYNVDPFADYTCSRHSERMVSLSVDELRAFRDYRFPSRHMQFVQAYFMLSFYLCGMNVCDMLNVDLSKDYVKFKRIKTENRISSESWTIFSIPKEAKMLQKSGKLSLCKLNPKSGAQTKSLSHRMQYYLDTMRKLSIPSCDRLIYYSARKTFSQISAELGFSDAIIEYCIGDQHTITKSIDYYRHVTKSMADSAIRIVLDYVASDKDIKTFKKERGLL